MIVPVNNDVRIVSDKRQFAVQQRSGLGAWNGVFYYTSSASLLADLPREKRLHVTTADLSVFRGLHEHIARHRAVFMEMLAVVPVDHKSFWGKHKPKEMCRGNNTVEVVTEVGFLRVIADSLQFLVCYMPGEIDEEDRDPDTKGVGPSRWNGKHYHTDFGEAVCESFIRRVRSITGYPGESMQIIDGLAERYLSVVKGFIGRCAL